MREVYGFRDRGHEPCGSTLPFQGLRSVERGRGESELAEPLFEAAPFDQPRAEIVLPLDLPDLVDRDDVRMFELGDGFRFRAEPLDHRRRCEGAARDHLERDGPIQPELPCAVDDAHSPAGDLVENFVSAEPASRGIGIRRYGGHIGGERPGIPCDRRRRHEGARLSVGGKQLLHVVEQLGVTGGSLLDEPAARCLVLLECCEEELRRTLPPHPGPSRAPFEVGPPEWVVVSILPADLSHQIGSGPARGPGRPVPGVGRQ